MNVIMYKSTDAGAPALTGAAGSLLALLDACLVNGYGAKAAAGWSKPFANAANKGCYLQSTVGSNNPSGMGLAIDDSGPGAGSFREARVCGFEALTSVSAGTGQFPTVAQMAIGTGQLVIRKSATADATARAWTLIASGQTFYLFIESGDSIIPLATTTFCFGDFKSFKSADQYAVMIIGRTAENTGSTAQDALWAMNCSNTANISLVNCMYGHYVARHWTGIGGSVKVGKPCPISMIAATVAANFWVGPYSGDTQVGASPTNPINTGLGRYASSVAWPSPNGPDSSIQMSPVWLNHNNAIRGYLYGLWNPMHDRPLGHNDTFSVAGGNLNGKSFIAQNIQAYIAQFTNGDNGQVIIETTSTWS